MTAYRLEPKRRYQWRHCAGTLASVRFSLCVCFWNLNWNRKHRNVPKLSRLSCPMATVEWRHLGISICPCSPKIETVDISKYNYFYVYNNYECICLAFITINIKIKYLISRIFLCRTSLYWTSFWNFHFFLAALFYDDWWYWKYPCFCFEEIGFEWSSKLLSLFSDNYYRQ